VPLDELFLDYKYSRNVGGENGSGAMNDMPG